MSAGIFVFDVIATLLLSGGLLFSYGNWLRQHLVTAIFRKVNPIEDILKNLWPIVLLTLDTVS